MRTHSVYAIHWEPAGSVPASENAAAYHAGIERYFGDVAHDSGTNASYGSGLLSNVYSTDAQFYDTSGAGGARVAGSYASAFAGSVVDTTPYPTSGNCTPYPSSTGGPLVTACLTDGQIAAEVSAVVSAHGWPHGLGAIYLMFTPKNVGSCDPTGTQCAFIYYCAYHTSTSLNTSTELLYANMPYADTNASACQAAESPGGAPQSPSGNAAVDDELSITSHEHNETVTDPNGDAWWDHADSSGGEDGDKCAYRFGNPAGGPAGSEYNQVINGDHYWVQQEYSNAHYAASGTGCAQNMLALAPSVSVSSPAGATTGNAVTFDASASVPVPGAAGNTYTWDFGDGSATQQTNSATVQHTYTAASTPTYTVTVRADSRDAAGNHTATSTPTTRSITVTTPTGPSGQQAPTPSLPPSNPGSAASPSAPGGSRGSSARVAANSRQRLSTALRRGITFAAFGGSGRRLHAVLLIEGATARRLRFERGARAVVVGAASLGQGVADGQRVTVRISSAAQARLKHAGRVLLTLVVTLSQRGSPDIVLTTLLRFG